VPLEGPAHDALFADLDAAFERHARAGRIELACAARVFVGEVA
jgi:hypothetical protein